MDKKEGLFFGIIFCLGFVLAITGLAIEGNVESSVNIDGLRILYETFNGVTTDFNSFNITQLNNFSNAIFEKTSYGKVEFLENLNLTQLAGGDRLVDFDSDLIVSSNLISTSSVSLPGINKLAILSFYSIAYSNPLIYHNSVLCSDCTFVSYTGGIYKFRVSSFDGYYSLRESAVCGNGICESGESESSCPADCTVTPPSTGGGGGGGGGVPSTNGTEVVVQGVNFTVYPTLFDVEMKKGTYFSKKIIVVNGGTKEITIGISVEGLQDFVIPKEKAFVLAVGETKEINLDIYVSVTKPADVYVGKIIFSSGGLNRIVNAIINVKEEDALFDIRTEVLKKYINPGGRVRANISLINMGDLRNFDVSLEYKVIDFDKNEYTLKKEDFAINQTYNNIFFLDLPEDIEIGDYLFYSKVNYKDVSASSYDTFVVEKVSLFTWIVLIVIILLLMYLVYRWYKHQKYKLMHPEEIKKKAIEIKKRKEEPFGGRLLKVPKLPRSTDED